MFQCRVLEILPFFAAVTEPYTAKLKYVILTIFKPHINHFPNNNFKLSQMERLQTTIFNLMKMVESFPNGWKTLWEKEKFLLFLH